MGKLGQKITTNAATLGHHAGRHWGYLKKTLGHGSSAINMAQGLTAAAGMQLERICPVLPPCLTPREN